MPAVKPSNDLEMQQVCAYRPKDGNMMDNIPCCASLHDKLAFKLIVFILVFALDAIDVVTDWWLYHDVSATEEGLVYGPAEDSIRYSLLVFSIIGSLTFTFEIANLWWEIFRHDPWIDVDLLSAICVWIEDVPQITINVFIAACREEAISYFQLVKASVIIFGAFVRIIISLVRYCNKRSRQDLQCAKVNPESRRHVIYRAFIMTGLILTLGGAVAVFMFTQAERNPDGSLNFKIPHSLIEGEYNDERYFQNVSIFFSHEMFDYDTTPNAADDINLVRLLMINDIKKQEKDRTVKIKFKSASPSIFMEVSDSGKTECFDIDRTNKNLNIPSSCTISAPFDEFVITFQYTKASVPKLLFGDIKYNIKVKNGTTNQCMAPSFSIKKDVSSHSEDHHVAAFHYYRTKSGVSNDYHVIHDAGTNTGKFYHSSDLIDITEVWQTGFAYCKTSGSLAPHEDTGINVPCT